MKPFHRSLLALSALPLLTNCAEAPADPQEAFFDALSAHCGQAFAGELVSDDAADDDLRGKPMVMHVRECTETELRIPFHVGEDRSRTWVLTKGGGAITLKHDHRHEDGEEDVLTQYGGTTDTKGSAARQQFPVDQYSIDLFNRENIPASTVNVWAMDVVSNEMFAYELSRPNRFFRVEFDLTTPVETPPAPW